MGWEDSCGKANEDENRLAISATVITREYWREKSGSDFFSQNPNTNVCVTYLPTGAQEDEY